MCSRGIIVFTRLVLQDCMVPQNCLKLSRDSSIVWGMLDSIVELLDSFASILDGFGRLFDGAAKLRCCVARLLCGFTKLLDGVARLLYGFARLSEGVSRLLDCFTRMLDDVARLLYSFTRIRKTLGWCWETAWLCHEIAVWFCRLLGGVVRLHGSVARLLYGFGRLSEGVWASLGMVSRLELLGFVGIMVSPHSSGLVSPLVWSREPHGPTKFLVSWPFFKAGFANCEVSQTSWSREIHGFTTFLQLYLSL